MAHTDRRTSLILDSIGLGVYAVKSEFKLIDLAKWWFSPQLGSAPNGATPSIFYGISPLSVASRPKLASLRGP